jgi:hypothetical protein
VARVPYNPVPDVSPQNIKTPSISISTPPAAFGGAVAQAIQHLGSTEEQVGGELFNRAVAMQQLRNETEATEGLANLERQSGDLRVKYLDSRGRNAVDQYANFRDANDNLRQSIRDGMSNPMAAKLYDRTALGVTNRAIIAGADHAATQNRQAAATAATTSIEAAQDTAGYSADDNEFNTHLRIIQGRTQQLGDLAGLDKDSVDQLVFKNQSKAIANRIAETSKKDPVEGSRMLDAAVRDGKLHSTDRDRVENQVHGRLDSVATRKIADDTNQMFFDPESFLAKRGSVRTQGVDPEFGQRLTAALAAAERATGERSRVESLVRSTDQQAVLYQKYLDGTGGLAAPPGTSRHETGRAADIPDGKVLDWLHQHAEEYGLEFLKGKAFDADSGHIQLSGGQARNSQRTYDVPERDVANEARARAAAIHNDPEFIQRSEQAAIGVYRRNLQYDLENDVRNKQTIVGVMQGDNPPSTVEDLLKVPGAERAWYDLKPTDRESLTKMINKSTPSDLAEKFRLQGMATHDEGIPDFLKEDLLHNPHLSNADKFKFFNEQNRLRQKSESDHTVNLAFSNVKHQIPQDMLQDKETLNRFRGALKTQLDLYREVHKTEMKGQDLQDTASKLLGDVDVLHGYVIGPTSAWGSTFWSRMFGSTNRLIEVPVPSGEYQAIKQEWAGKHNGAIPTDEQIQLTYTAKMYQDLYGGAKKEKK